MAIIKQECRSVIYIRFDIMFNFKYLKAIPREPAPTFQEKLLAGLREHIFNRMPIRLLHFIDQGSCLKISLLERGEVYAHLSSVIREDMPQNYREESDSEAIDQLVHIYSRYAILSHTWLRESPGEVTYGDWQRGTLNMSTLGYQKLVNFCKTAWREHKITLGWMDTVCINKESSSELDESIRSMFDWYTRADVCIIHLNDTQTLLDIHRDTWFTRGWTLQELLAPRWIKFCNRNWEYFVPDASANDKSETREIMSQIDKATSITYSELVFGIDDISLSRRMQMAASRKVTREEDTAYSLMGIFNVSISTAYGEGAERAFFRLLRAILESNSKGVLDFLNWAGLLPWSPQLTTFILPPSPKYYIHRSTLPLATDYYHHLLHPFKPLVITPKGLHISVVLMPGIFSDDRGEAVGDYSGTVHIPLSRHASFPTTFRVLDKRTLFDAPQLDEWEVRYKYTLAVFNIRPSRQGIVIPHTCWAKLLEYCLNDSSDLLKYTEKSYSVVQTLEPIIFKLISKQGNEWYGHHIVGEEEHISAELAAHGMSLTSMYL